MKGIKPIVMNPEDAKVQWKLYLKEMKKRKDKEFKQLKDSYYHLSKKRKIIDIYQAMKFAGLNQKQEPRLAIITANSKEVYFIKGEKGNGTFRNKKYYHREQVSLPEETFPLFTKALDGSEKYSFREIIAKVPPIPVGKLPNGNLKDHYILWEVKDWKIVPKDPFLLKRISNNLFVVIAEWDLTPLEQALMRGK